MAEKLTKKEKIKLDEIVKELVGEKPLLRINDLWVEVNSKVFGYKRLDVLDVITELGYKKKFISLTKDDGTKTALVGYVKGKFTATDKPVVDGYESFDGLNDKHARFFLQDLYKELKNDSLEIEYKHSTFFGYKVENGEVILRFTRKNLHELVEKIWYENGKCVKQGIIQIVRGAERISTKNFVRQNTYYKNKNGENRSRNKDVPFYTYTITI